MLFVHDFLADQQVFRRPDAPVAPGVSVVLPTYQRCRNGLLRRAVDSVLTQSFRDFELLVVDDGSVDGTRELIQALQRDDPRVVHVRHERNCGLPALRVNEGIELSRGRWVAFQFDDDEWLPGGLAALVEAAAEAGETSVVFGRALWVAETWRTELPRAPVSLATLAIQNDIANNAVLVPRRLFAQYGMYDPHVGLRRLCDWDLWLRLLAHGAFVAVERLVSRVPFVSDPTALGATAPLDLALTRFLLSIPRDEHLRADRWRDYAVDGLEVAGVALPAKLAERLERDQLVAFRARHRDDRQPRRDLGERTAPPPRVLLCAADDYRDVLDLGLGPCDARSPEGYKQVFHPIRELGREARQSMQIDLLLLAGTSSPTAAGIVMDVIEDGPPVAYHLGDGRCLSRRPASPELLHQLAAVDAVWSPSRQLDPAARPINPRVVPALAELQLHEAACRATALHAATRGRRIEGQPRVLYLFAEGDSESGQLTLLRALDTAKRYGIAPLAFFPAVATDLRRQLVERGIAWESGGVDRLCDVLAAARPVLVHAARPEPEDESFCALLQVPLVITPVGWKGRAGDLLALYLAAQPRAPIPLQSGG